MPKLHFLQIGQETAGPTRRLACSGGSRRIELKDDVFVFPKESAMKTLLVFLAAVTGMGITATVYAQNAVPQAAPDAATREWTKGNTKFTARFEKLTGNTAVFSKISSDGTSASKLGAALSSLSKEDQKWIHEYVKVQQAEKLAAWKQARTRARQTQRTRRY
jgi:hypothetical protein